MVDTANFADRFAADNPSGGQAVCFAVGIIRTDEATVKQGAEKFVSLALDWFKHIIAEHEFTDPHRRIRVVRQSDAGLFRTEIHDHDAEGARRQHLLLRTETSRQFIAGIFQPRPQQRRQCPPVHRVYQFVPLCIGIAMLLKKGGAMLIAEAAANVVGRRREPKSSSRK